MESVEAHPHTESCPARTAARRALAAWVILPLFFLLTGGSLDWWLAWIYCVALLAPMTIFLAYMVRRDPEFLARRMKTHEKDPVQRRILAWGYPSMLGALVIPGLDHRFGWSDPPPAVAAAAMAVVVVGYLGAIRAFLENRWAGRTIETWAGQTVISTGPYAVVRHPMYSAVLALYLATPVALGSWWALAPALAFVPIFVARIRNEEQTLVRELPGYDAYRERVRYRLVPFVW